MPNYHTDSAYISPYLGPEEEAVAVRERQAYLARLKAERESAEHERVMQAARTAIAATVDLQIKLGMLEALAAKGDIDKAFSRWCDAKPKAHALARLARLESAAASVADRGEVAVDYRRIELPDALVAAAAEALRIEFLADAERAG